MKRVVIVAPTYNEKENIASFLTAVLAEKENLPDYDLQVLVSDSHSRDGTAEIASRMARKDGRIRYLDVEKRGLGLGLVAGLDYAVQKMGADILVTMEADLSNNPGQLPDFLRALMKADVVIGSRYTKGGRIVNWSWWRKLLSLGANLVLGLLAFSFDVHEYTNLYRAFRREVWEDLRSKVSVYKDWIFVPAFAFEAVGSSYRVVEEPIVYYDRFGGRSKMRTISYTKNLLHYAFRFRVKRMLT